MVSNRRQDLIQLLVQDGKISVKDLAQKYGVSTETIRKDIAYLEQYGIAKKTHGGAIYMNDIREIPFYHMSIHRHEKYAIAKLATTLIQGPVVLMDGGSTTLTMAKLLSLRHQITIVTNSLSMGPILANASDVKLVLTGGEVRQINQDQVGFLAVRTIREISADACFIGTDSLSHPDGPSAYEMADVEIKQAMLQASRMRYLVVDSSKWETSSPYQFAKWQDFTAVITDSHIS
ncbi:MAG: DeoR/GlpR family DNA-binding transcription regulator, partial [Firmicutes bacterium]|nr:DeoR/GlpR family DNA-binding transcription regulator [Bacillota bacterium]